MREANVNVLIVGAGPTGLAAGGQLAKLGINDVLILDREKQSGGTPRQCHHTGFGMRDLHRVYTGPQYAKKYSNRAKQAGVKIQTESAVTGWVDENTVVVSSPAGLETIHAKVILLATGCRERPRAARLVPGFRPQGVFTTGSLQHFVHEHNMTVGKKAVIVGSELVSYSAVHTLKKAKCDVVRIVTEHPKHQVYMPYVPYKWWTADILGRIPFSPSTNVTEILGRNKLTGVAIQNGTKSEVVKCDAVVFSGDWIPDHELARLAEMDINPQTNGPLVDTQYRTSQKGIFAAGNILRGAEPGDVAALEGKAAAGSIKEYLDSENWIDDKQFVQTIDPIEWLVPSVIPADGKMANSHFLFRVKEFLKNQMLTIKQGNKVIYQKNYRSLGPNYSFKLKNDWIKNLNGTDDITVTLS